MCLGRIFVRPFLNSPDRVLCIDFQFSQGRESEYLCRARPVLLLAVAFIFMRLMLVVRFCYSRVVRRNVSAMTDSAKRT